METGAARVSKWKDTNRRRVVLGELSRALLTYHSVQEACCSASESKISSALSLALTLIQNFQAEGIGGTDAPPLCISWCLDLSSSVQEKVSVQQGILITGLPAKARCSDAKGFVNGKGIILNNGDQYQLLNE